MVKSEEKKERRESNLGTLRAGEFKLIRIGLTVAEFLLSRSVFEHEKLHRLVK